MYTYRADLREDKVNHIPRRRPPSMALGDACEDLATDPRSLSTLTHSPDEQHPAHSGSFRSWMNCLIAGDTTLFFL